MPNEPTLVGGYAIGEHLGSGGMGSVYKATAPDGRVVAVKLLHVHLTLVEEYVKRFQREAKLAEKLAHPNVVRVLSSGEDNGQHYIVMEYVEGESLTERLERFGILAPGLKATSRKAAGNSPPVIAPGCNRESPNPLQVSDTHAAGLPLHGTDPTLPCDPPVVPAAVRPASAAPVVRNLPIPEVIKLLRQVAGVLQAAADIGLVHRDLKPQNILLDRAGNAKVLDFGLAKDSGALMSTLSMTGQIVGTPPYMSPEQCEGLKEADIRSDLYSLGATAYQMLTGRPPFPGPTHSAYIKQHCEEIPVPVGNVNPVVPRNVSQVIDRLLAKKPADRHQTPAELIEDLNRVERGEVPLKLHKPKKSRQHSVGVTLAVAAVAVTLALIAVGVWLGWGGHNEAVRVVEEVSQAKFAADKGSTQSALERLDRVIAASSAAKTYTPEMTSALKEARALRETLRQRQIDEDKSARVRQVQQEDAARQQAVQAAEQERQREFRQKLTEAESALASEETLDTGLTAADRAVDLAREPNEEISAKALREKVVVALKARRELAAVVDFTVDTSVTDKGLTGRAVATKIEQAVSDRFRLVDRTQIAKALQELKFSVSDLADKSKAQQFGKMVSARYLITGEVVQVGGVMTIAAKLFAVETGILKQTAEVEARTADDFNAQFAEIARVLPMDGAEKKTYLKEQREYPKLIAEGRVLSGRERWVEAEKALLQAQANKATSEVTDLLANVRKRTDEQRTLTGNKAQDGIRQAQEGAAAVERDKLQAKTATAVTGGEKQTVTPVTNVVEMVGTAETIISSGNVAAYCWSPDGRRLAFLRNTGGQPLEQELCLANADGTGVSVIYREARCNVLDWGVIGAEEYILFVRYKQSESEARTYKGSTELWRIRPDGTGARQLTFTKTNGIHQSIWPQYAGVGTVEGGGFLAGAAGSLCYYNAHNSNGWPKAYTSRTDGTKSYSTISPNWAWNWGVSPDRKKLLYATSSNWNTPHTLYICNSDGSETVQLAGSLYPAAAQFAASPDGKRVLYVSGSLSWQAYNVMSSVNLDLSVVNSDGKGVTIILGDKHNELLTGYISGNVLYSRPTPTGTWSPDGQRVVFASDRSGTSDVYSIGADGSGLQRHSASPAIEFHPLYSPDGSRIAYLRDVNNTPAEQADDTLVVVATHPPKQGSASKGASNASTSAADRTAADANSAPGPIAWWKFDEGSGTVAADSSGSGNTGTLKNGPAWTTGVSNGALSFDGVDDVVEAGSNGDTRLNPSTHAFTAALLFRTSSTTGEQALLNNFYGTSGEYGWYLGLLNGCLRFRFGGASIGQGSWAYDHTVSSADGKWHHLAFVRDTAANAARFYLDGALLSGASFAFPNVGSDLNYASAKTTMGKLSTNTVYYFNGALDDVRIYDCALPASAVQAIVAERTPALVWKRLANCAAQPAAGAAIVGGNKLLLAGGSYPSHLRDTQIYDPATNAWSRVPAKLPTGRYSTAVGGVANPTTGEIEMYVAAGYTGFQGTGVIEKYTPSTNTWTSVPARPANQGETPGSFVLGGKLYVMGGHYNNGNLTSAIHCYDPVVNAWSTAGSITRGGTALPMQRMTVAVRGTDVYLFGGVIQAGAVITDSTLIWHTATNTWSEGAPMPQPSHSNDADAFVVGDCAYVYARCPDMSAKTVFVYRFSTDTWETLAAPFPGLAVKAPVTLQAGNRWYVVSGWDASENELAETWVAMPDFDPAAGATNAQEYAANTNPTDANSAPGPIAWWKFDEGSGTVAADSSGSGNTGTLKNGPAWTKGVSNGALNFDGSNDVVDAGMATVIRLTGAMTASLWVKPNAGALSGDPRFFGRSGRDVNTGISWNLGLNAGKPSAWISSNGTAFTHSISGSTGLTAGRWYCLTMVYKPSTYLRVYLDGVLAGENTSSIPAALYDPSNATLCIGGTWYDGGTPGFPLNGALDEVNLYNYARTPEQIKADASLGTGSLSTPARGKR